MKLLLTDSATLKSENDLSLDCFKKFGQVSEFDCLSHSEVLKQAADADIILCNKTVIDEEVFEAAKKLKYIGLFATGYNNIDTACADKYGVTVCNAGSYSTSAVAQQVFAYILNHYSKIGEYANFVAKGGWQKSSNFSVLCYPTDELAGKTIGIIGYGSIGKRVEAIAKAFEMKVLVYTRTPKNNGFTSFVDLDYLLANSDIVSLHCPLNSQSEKLFNKTTFAKMRKGAFFINTARGGIVDETALKEALLGGQLSGAAIDVLTYEPMSKDCVLLGAPNLVITPHTAWAPLTTRLRLLDIVQNNIKAFLEGKPQNVVNNPKK
ncbi:MAG: D-2-hydroxyacid dehydrogenase [Clostridia bacterium]|nr:D-2-hydroxyacid dehydrogenase [Clostridia bacterium]